MQRVDEEGLGEAEVAVGHEPVAVAHVDDQDLVTPVAPEPRAPVRTDARAQASELLSLLAH